MHHFSSGEINVIYTYIELYVYGTFIADTNGTSSPFTAEIYAKRERERAKSKRGGKAQ